MFLSFRRALFHLTLAASALLAQTQFPPGTIDGSKTPSLIPDATAYRLVFRALAEPPNASLAQVARQKRKLSRIVSSEAEYLGFSAALADFQVKYFALLAQYRPKQSQAPSQSFVATRDGIVSDTLVS